LEDNLKEFLFDRLEDPETFSQYSKLSYQESTLMFYSQLKQFEKDHKPEFTLMKELAPMEEKEETGYSYK
jgi:hypothetical protein